MKENVMSGRLVMSMARSVHVRPNRSDGWRYAGLTLGTSRALWATPPRSFINLFLLLLPPPRRRGNHEKQVDLAGRHQTGRWQNPAVQLGSATARGRTRLYSRVPPRPVYFHIF